MTLPTHSIFSASAADRWMQCPGSIPLTLDKVDTTSEYAAEGTAAHQVLTWALQTDTPAAGFIGREINPDGFRFTVDPGMAGHVQTCIDYVKDVAGADGAILVDQRVNYARYLGTAPELAYGTADVIVLKGDEIVVIDFKYGQGVMVSAENNRQMSLYALGALEMLQGVAGDFRQVRMAISQPRVTSAASEYDMPVAELEMWAADETRAAVTAVMQALDVGAAGDLTRHLNPGEKQCRWCSAKATCPALRDEVAEVVTGHPVATPDEFLVMADAKAHLGVTAAEWLAACLSKVDLIEDWCKAVRAEVERRLLAGEEVPGYKVVQGKRGARQWVDAAAAEALLKGFKVKVEDMYDMKLISPTSAEKLAKANTIGPRQWPKVLPLITQPEGRPHVAPLSDSRPALDIRPVAEDFKNLAA